MQKALQPAGDDLGLVIMVQEVTGEVAKMPGRPYVISIYGADRPGIVFRVSEALARRNVNITHLSSHLVEGIYNMVLDIDVPESIKPTKLEEELRDAAALEVELTFREADADRL